MMKWFTACILALCLLAFGAPATAQLEPRRKHVGVFDEANPRPVVLRIVPGVGESDYQYVGVGGALEYLVGNGIAQMLHQRRSERNQASLAALDEAVPAERLSELLAESLPRRLSSLGFLDLRSPEIIVLTSEQALPPPPEDALVLTFHYHFSDFYRALHVKLDAVVAGTDYQGKPAMLFHQRLYYSLNARQIRGAGKRDEQFMAFWTASDALDYRRTLEAAPDALMEMLAFDLPLTVARGRTPGKQFPFHDDPPLSNYGVPVEVRGARHWLRLRNGYLVNVPTNR